MSCIAPPDHRAVARTASFQSELPVASRKLVKLLRRVQRAIPMCRRAAFGRKVLPIAARQLCDALAFHFSLEEFVGYLNDPLNESPTARHAARALWQEHPVLFAECQSIADQADRLVRRASTARRVRCVAKRLSAFCDMLRRHEQRERALLLDALHTDIGVGD